MSYVNEKTGEIVLSQEDRENLREPLPKKWAMNIINKIIWSDNEHFYDKSL